MATETDAILGNGDSSRATNSLPGAKWKTALAFLLGIGATALVFSLVPAAWRQHDVSHNKSSATYSDYVMSGDDVLELEDDGRRYKATQFISFTINTLGGSAEHGECDGKKVDPNTNTCYLGNHKNLTEDILHRLDIVGEVLDRLAADVFRESPDVDRNKDVLKILMIPEFMFRGPNGAYSVEQILDDNGALVEFADRLHEMVAVDAFEDYLFVFGTVIAAQALGNPKKPWDEGTTADDVLYYNFAPVFRGGTSRSLKSIVTKKFISDADFLTRTKLPNPTKAGIRGYSDVMGELQQKFESRGTQIVEDNLIELDGIKIGLEICLDHRMGALWNSLKTRHNSHLVDVQLIVSAGMAIERGPNPLVPGGVVYLSDGEASSAACIRTSTGEFDSDTVCREDVGGLKHIPVGGPGYSNFFPLAACIDLEASDLLKGYYSLYQTQGCAYTLKLYDINVMDAYKYYPPSIEIYPTVALPGFD